MLSNLVQASTDVKILVLSVVLRRASFGFTNQVLALFLEVVGISRSDIGTFMTFTLLGDSVISLLLTWFSDRLGRRLVMIVGCVLMLVSGLIFATATNFWVLLSAAIIGVISTSGDETGPFKTVEEACLSHLTEPSQRAPIFAIYGLSGLFGSAIGSYVCGVLVNYWNTKLHWQILRSYRAIFLCYSAVACSKLILALCLSKNCEISVSPTTGETAKSGATETTTPVTSEPEISGSTQQASSNVEGTSISEETRLLSEHVLSENETADNPKPVTWKFGLRPQSKRHLYRLLVVFMLDSFGYGFMPPAWIVYYFHKVFDVSPTSLGSLFFFTNLVDSFSSAASLATFSRFGPIKAILVAQLPSAIFFSVIPFCRTFLTAGVCYFLFCACGSMDVVPRQVLLTSIIPKEDLIKVFGIVNIAKTFARSVGPLFTGHLAQMGKLYVAYFVNGGCLFLADLILGFSFIHLDSTILAYVK